MTPTLELRRPRKREAIKRALAAMIEAQGLAPGERIPGQVELAAHFDTTEVTIHRALVELEQEGVIHRVSGKGTFVGPASAHQRTRTLCLVLPGEHLDDPAANPEFWPTIRQLMHAFVTVAGEGWRFATVAASSDTDMPPALEELDARDVVFFHHTKLPRGLLRRLIQGGKVPVVAFGLPDRELPCLTVDHDPVNGVRKSVAHLAQLGFRRIALAGASEAWGKPWREGYRLGLADFGLPREEELVVLGNGGQTQTAGHQDASVLLRRGLKCDAILADSDMRALGIIECLRHAGVAVPRDMAVMGYDGLDNTVLQPPFLTSLRIPLEQMIHAAVETVDQTRATRSPVQHLKFTGEVVPGRTAVAAPQANGDALSQ